MTTLAIIAACYGAGLLAARAYNTGHRHSVAMLEYKPPTFGTDSLVDWGRELGPTALHVVK